MPSILSGAEYVCFSFSSCFLKMNDVVPVLQMAEVNHRELYYLTVTHRVCKALWGFETWSVLEIGALLSLLGLLVKIK